ncbi:hypothetical protein F4859DRAFT_480421 [Xylaria cf. heliscus]|nr:hypothetical protein F4859DRAFT_480421 [Xylaria cf. heliscus]
MSQRHNFRFGSLVFSAFHSTSCLPISHLSTASQGVIKKPNHQARNSRDRDLLSWQPLSSGGPSTSAPGIGIPSSSTCRYLWYADA